MLRFYYLIYSLGFLLVLMLILRMRRDLWSGARAMIVIGAIGGPLSELLYLRDYWQPMTLFGQGIISLEDVLFGASFYSLAVVLYPFLFNKRLSLRSGAIEHHKRMAYFAIVLAITLALLLVMNLALGINSVFATLLALTPTWLMVIALRPDLAKPSLWSGFLSSGLATLIYILGLNIVAPHILERIWLLHSSSLGWTILGNIPVSELLWFFVVGGYISILYMFATHKEYVVAKNVPSA